mgnify:CR=1 FL=1
MISQRARHPWCRLAAYPAILLSLTPTRWPCFLEHFYGHVPTRKTVSRVTVVRRSDYGGLERKAEDVEMMAVLVFVAASTRYLIKPQNLVIRCFLHLDEMTVKRVCFSQLVLCTQKNEATENRAR